jgi:hypothetical protein
MLKSLLYVALSLFIAAALFTTALPTTAGAQAQPVGSDTKAKSYPHKICPGKKALDATATYPKGTGNDLVDQFFLKKALDFVNLVGVDYLAEDGVLYDETWCDSEQELSVDMSFETTSPGPGFLGVLLTYSEALGGVHPSYWYRSLNFDLSNGKEITVHDLFSDPQKGIAGIFALAYKELCSQTSEHDPAFYVLGASCEEDPQPPAELLAVTGGLDGLGHMTLAPGGASLNFSPYEIWSWSQGDYVLQIPAPAMLALGARDYWGQGANTVNPNTR